MLVLKIQCLLLPPGNNCSFDKYGGTFQPRTNWNHMFDWLNWWAISHMIKFIRHMFCAILLVIYHQVLMITQEHLKIRTKKHGSFNQAEQWILNREESNGNVIWQTKAWNGTMKSRTSNRERTRNSTKAQNVNQERSWTHHKHSMRTSRKREDLKERRSCTEEKS